MPGRSGVLSQASAAPRSSDMTASVVVLISGTGSNLKALLDASTALGYDVVAVVSNRDAQGLGFARERQIPAHVVKVRRGEPREDYDTRLAAALAPYPHAMIVLAGFMRILSAAFVARCAGRLVNIHPSLLPHYRGLDVHRRVLADAAPLSGASVHVVTPELDAGPVLMQGTVPVLDSDDEIALSARVHRAEHIIYPATVGLIASGRLRLFARGVELDGKVLTAPLIGRFDADGEMTEWPDGIDCFVPSH